MGSLNCELSALVFAELYQHLLTDQTRRDELLARLETLNVGLEWLSTMAEAYDAKWRAESRWLTAENVDGYVLDVEHAVVATWILAGLRNTGHSHDYSSDLRMSVTERAIREIDDDLPSSLPAALSPAVIGWTLGRVEGSVDGSLPVVPAYPLPDPFVYSAYEGLVEHVIGLPAEVDSLPELAGSATYVRSAGLAEALVGDEGGPQRALDKLMRETSLLTPSNVRTRLQRHWVDFVDRRNVLTHIRADTGGMTFAEATVQSKAWQHLKLTVEGITHFVCQAISGYLYEHMPPPVHGDPWEKFIRRDLETWD
ncbi:hypothetical protein [Gordonia alkanivorans]|nr:hypothetical protein [Gordonia alkanivorans]MDH3010074.1 hypothetical protein [Gordonia alkanivorans]